MEPREVSRLFPELLEKIEDSTIKQLLGMEPDGHAAWMCRDGDSLPIVQLFPRENQIRVTVGVVAEAPYTPTVAEIVNRHNRRELVLGRMYFVGPGESGLCAVLMQEIVPGELLSWDYVPSLQYLLQVIARLSGQGSRFANEIAKEIGGRLFRDDEALVVMTSG